MKIRNVVEADYGLIIPVLNQWWGGRSMTDMLPRLFFIHFSDTSFVIEELNQIAAFLIGFVSQTYLNEAYVHFMGVNPKYRSQGLGRRIYEQFFTEVRSRNCNLVRSVTSPFNTRSIAFHQRLGFEIEKSNDLINTIPTMRDYDGLGEHRVCFVKYLEQS
ncbi:MAG: GNAT family N-acetyltransferase [Leptolyngbyaceae cyanobacterium bins.302]|nr:GNAT family N-acetyltransferase [Leptolyngbyaceae cyanobacterium bins.302]